MRSWNGRRMPSQEPSEEIRPQIPPRFALRSFVELKRVWGVSIAALLYRARTLGVMTETAYRRSVIAMSKQYGRRQEPGDLGPAECALLLRRAAELFTSGDPVEALARAMRLSVATVSEILDDPVRPQPTITPELLLRDPR